MHLRLKHNIALSSNEQNMIMRLCFVKKSICMHTSQPPLVPLDFMEWIDGYQCGSCIHYGREVRFVREHAQKKHNNDKINPCKVQIIWLKVAYKHNFGVLDGPEVVDKLNTGKSISRTVTHAAPA